MRVILEIPEEILERIQGFADNSFMSRKKLMEKIISEYRNVPRETKDYSNSIESIKNPVGFTDRVALNIIPIEDTKPMFTEPINKYEVHKQSISASKTRDELGNNVNAMKKDMFLLRNQKFELESYAKVIMEEKGFIFND